MHILNPTARLLPVFIFVLSACGDVGDAPEAQISEAVAVNETGGQVFAIDTARSEIHWRAAKVTRAHDGGFRTFQGTISMADGDMAGADITIDTRSIWSDTDRLTNHLKSDDFFDVEAYPEARFVADQFAPTDSTGATHLVTGNLTMHGQTNSITFPATIAVQDGSVQASADIIIDRTDWGINYRGQADDLIDNEVRLIFDVAAPTSTSASVESSLAE